MEYDVIVAPFLAYHMFYDPQNICLLCASIMDSFGCIMAGSVDFSSSGSASTSSGILFSNGVDNTSIVQTSWVTA